MLDAATARSPAPDQAKTEPDLERPASELGEPVRPMSTASRIYSRVRGAPPPDGKFDPAYEVTWDGERDPANPFNWSPLRQWYT